MNPSEVTSDRYLEMNPSKVTSDRYQISILSEKFQKL